MDRQPKGLYNTQEGKTNKQKVAATNLSDGAVTKL